MTINKNKKYDYDRWDEFDVQASNHRFNERAYDYKQKMENRPDSWYNIIEDYFTDDIIVQLIAWPLIILFFYYVKDDFFPKEGDSGASGPLVPRRGRSGNDSGISSNNGSGIPSSGPSSGGNIPGSDDIDLW